MEATWPTGSTYKPDDDAPPAPIPGWPDSSMLEAAWGLIANAGGAHQGWESCTPDWREAAEKWRDAYHRILQAQYEDPANDREPITEESYTGEQWTREELARECRRLARGEFLAYERRQMGLDALAGQIDAARTDQLAKLAEYVGDITGDLDPDEDVVDAAIQLIAGVIEGRRLAQVDALNKALLLEQAWELLDTVHDDGQETGWKGAALDARRAYLGVVEPNPGRYWSRPRAALIEIVEQTDVRDIGEYPGIVVPKEVRIEGIPLLADDKGVKVHDITTDGYSAARVTLTLYARRVVIGQVPKATKK